jgi:hypothetical protein
MNPDKIPENNKKLNKLQTNIIRSNKNKILQIKI